MNKSKASKLATFAGILGLSLFMMLPSGLAQNGNSLDNFLDDEDFEGPPPAGGAAPQANAPNFNNRKTFDGTDNGKNGAAAPTPRRKRNEPPNLLAHRPPNMAEATDEEITNENFPDLIDSFDYPNADIADIVKAISELTGKNFIVDPQVRGKITIIAPSRVTVAEAYKAFLSALAINGFTVVPSGKFWKIKQAQNAQRDNLDTYSGNYSPNTDNMITRIVQMKHIQVKDVYNSLGPILQSRLGEMRAYEPTNTLIISDYGSNIERIMKILHQLDVPGFEEQIEVLRVKYAKADDLAKLIDQIINKGKNSQQGNVFTAGIPRFTPLGGVPSGSSGTDAFSLVIPETRTNSLIVVGNSEGVDKIRKLVAKLDFRIRPEDAGGVYVYYVRFGDAEKIATTLSGLAQAAAQTNTQTAGAVGSATAPAIKTGVFGGDVKIVSDKTTNSLIVTASKPDYEVVRAILAKLDVPRDQVFVEGIILEMGVDNVKSFGVNYYNIAATTPNPTVGQPPLASLAGGQGFTSTSLTDILNPTNDTGAILGFGAGSIVQITPPGSSTPVNIPSLVGLINFLSSITNVNILSTPQIIALDNEEAEIEVGEKVPVAASQTQTTTGSTTTSVTREDVTIKLNIKPHISPGSNTMRLEINQQIQDIAPTQVQSTQLANNGLSTTKRFAKTNVIVRDKDTVVLGGLMEDKEKVNITKIPVLGDIPIIGWLFKGKHSEVQKTNLLMFLTPKIIRSQEDSATLLTRKLRERVNWIQKNVGGKDTQGDFMDSLRIEKDGKVEPVEPVETPK